MDLHKKEKPGRRRFIKEITGAAVCGACFRWKALAGPAMVPDTENGTEHLVAVCGLYCGACVIRAAVKKNDPQMLEMIADGLAKYLGRPVGVEEVCCDGCLSDVRAAPCRDCEIRDCAVSKGITH